ncbi:MAG: hypothetical protein EOM59_04405 [Clostridia bacterium]|nr:hypothetical protein [Clostridia bacterium]
MSDNPNNENQNAPLGDEYSDLPPYLQKYFRFKDALKGPELLRGEDGLTPKRFSKTYFEDTCPYCETTADHEGKKYRYSRVTKKKILLNITLMFAVAILTGVGILNMFVGLAAIVVLGYTLSTHTERKMYFSLLCRKCGSHFPMDKNEQDKIRQEEKENREEEAKQEAQQKQQEQEQEEEYSEEEEAEQ